MVIAAVILIAVFLVIWIVVAPSSLIIAMLLFTPILAVIIAGFLGVTYMTNGDNPDWFH